MTIFDKDGKRFDSNDTRCPCCGAHSKNFEKVNGFGGHSRVVCIKCGVIVEMSSPVKEATS